MKWMQMLMPNGKLDCESVYMQDMAAPSSTDHTDFTKHRGVRPTKSGKWGATIRHPITKVPVWLGSYNTPKEAADAYTKRKLEYDSVSLHEMAASFPTEHPGVTHTNSGKWGAKNQHPINKIQQTYNSLEEAADAYSKKKLEFDSAVPSQPIGCLRKLPCGVYRRKSGRWQAQMRINNTRICVGTYDTVEEAEEAINRKRHEVEFMVQNEMKCKESDVHVEEAEKKHRSKARALVLQTVSEKYVKQAGLQVETTWTPRNENYESDFGSKMTTQQPVALERDLQEADSSFLEDEVKKDEPICEKPFTAQAVSNTGATNRVRRVPGTVYRVKAGTGRWRWRAEIRTKKVRVNLGTYTTAEEARKALDRKRHDLDSTADPHMNRRQSKVHVEGIGKECGCTEHELDTNFGSKGTGKQSVALSDHQEISSSQDIEFLNGKPTYKQHSGQKVTNATVRNCRSRPLGVFQRKSGRWYAEIRNPMTKSRNSVGTYDTAEEAAEALKIKRHEFASMDCAQKKHKQLNVNAEEKTQVDSATRYNVDSILECESGLASKPQDIVSEAGGSKITFVNGDECRESNMNAENIQIPKEQFDMGVINAYGQLIGKFSRMDDELWLSGSLDDCNALDHISSFA